MNAGSARNFTSRERRVVVFPEGQIALLLLVFGVSSALILATIQQGSWNSVFLLGFVSVSGLVLCRSTQVHLNDPSLKILGYFWLIKLGLTIFLLYVGWMPQLDQATSDVWGYDPQRYYIQAQELIDNNWAPEFISLNYVGVLYYYGAIFYVLGHNPVIPALINAFVTLIASLYLVKVGYEIKGERSSRDWTLAFALILPELVWYDVMTSRETAVAALLLFAMLTTGRYLARTAPVSLFKVLIIGGLSVLAIGALRTSMLLPMVASVAFMALLIKPQRGRWVVQRTILSVIAAGALLLGTMFMTGYLGGYDFEVGKALQVAISAKENIALTSGAEWSENSIGMLLLPEGVLQSILFLIPRMVLYLVAPLPKVFIPVSDLLAGDWRAWQKLFTLLSSVINVLAMPFVLASFVLSMKTRNANAAPFVFHISYWITFMAVAGGNLIIHERYRVMASLLLWGCAWLGVGTCSKRLIVSTSLIWYFLLSLGASIYIFYKFALI